MKEFNPFILAWTELQKIVDQIEIKSFDDIETAKDILKDCTDLEKKIEDTRTSITKPINDMLKSINNLAKEVSIPVNEAKLNIKKKIVDFNERQEKLKKQEAERIDRIVSQIWKSVDVDSLNMYVNTLDEIEQNNFVVKTAIFNIKMKLEEEKRRLEEEKKRKEEQEQLEKEKKLMSEEQSKIAEEKMKIEQEKREIEEEKKKQAEQKIIDEAQKKSDNSVWPMKVKWIRSTTKWEIVNEKEVPILFCSPDSKKINEAIRMWITSIPWLKMWEETTVQ